MTIKSTIGEKACPNCQSEYTCHASCTNMYRNTDPRGCFCLECLSKLPMEWTWKDLLAYIDGRKGCNLISEEFWKIWKNYFVTHWKFLP